MRPPDAFTTGVFTFLVNITLIDKTNTTPKAKRRRRKIANQSVQVRKWTVFRKHVVLLMGAQ